jgi:cob(I)alamin adenosyltransferase
VSNSFDKPRSIAINRVYTRKGDEGETRLVGGQKVSKQSLRIESYGTVDELNAFVGQARQTIVDWENPGPLDRLEPVLRRIQHELFNLGSILATLPEDVHPKQPRVRAEDIERLEREMDALNEDLPDLRSFVLPGASRLNTDLHLCRTVCRRAERICVALAAQGEETGLSIAYLNRLSDAFFIFSRWCVQAVGHDELLWDPNAVNEDKT